MDHERDKVCTCGHHESNHAKRGLRSCCRSTAEGECGCPGFTAQNSEPDEAKEQAISDLLEKIANLPGITPEDLELLQEITQR
jgi:flavodoxin